MACEDYNIVKEGNITNVVGTDTVVLTDSQLNALYDASVGSNAIIASGTVHLLVEFGEAYDVCYVDYYTDETNLSNIDLSYGTNSLDTDISFSSISSGHLRATVNDFSRQFELVHTISGSSTINQLKIVAERLEKVGAGTAPSGQDNFIFENSPVGHLSSNYHTIQLFNDSNVQKTAKVAVAPLLIDADNYVYLSTTPSGVYKGINDNGVVFPATKTIPLSDDSLQSTTLNSQWERVLSGVPHNITPTSEGLLIDSSYKEDQSTRALTTPSYHTIGIISKEYFAAQGFTAQIEVKVDDIETPDFSLDSDARHLFFVLTNNYPIPDLGFHEGYMTDNRRGMSIAGVSLRPNATAVSRDTLSHRIRVIDGNSSNRPFDVNNETRWTGSGSTPGSGSSYEVEGPTLSQLEDVWATWKIVYDADGGKITAYVDDNELGSYTFVNEKPLEGCKLFFGFQGHSGRMKTTVRNFKIIKDNEENEEGVPWAEGSWNNLVQDFGSENSLRIRDVVSAEIAETAVPERLREFVDYRFSSAVNKAPGIVTSDIDYHYARTLFSIPRSQYAGWFSDNQSDNNFWVWRTFEESSDVKGIYWDANVSSSPTVPDKFKFQYLLQDGDPNDEDSWADIPVISTTHPYTDTDEDTAYKDYKDFLISNNDGEFYNSYYNRPSDTGFSLGDTNSPKGTAVPNDYPAVSVITSPSNSAQNGLNGYIEFDSAIKTRGIKFVVHTTKTTVSPSGQDTDYVTLENLKVFRSHGAGSYLSPVIDTGTPQNTERLFSSITTVSGTDYQVYYRSSSEKPQYAYDFRYETWEDLGVPGDIDTVFAEVLGFRDRVAVRDDKAIFLLGIVGGITNTPYSYDLKDDFWEDFPSYPGGGPGLPNIEDPHGGDSQGDIYPDDSVIDNAAVLNDGNVYLAAYTLDGAVRTPRILRYNDTDGWVRLHDSRQDFSENSLMVPYEDKLYFFNREGTISYYNATTNIWTITNSNVPLHGLDFFRDNLCGCVFGNKIYLIGGRGTSGSSTVYIDKVDIYHIDEDIITSGSSAPYPVPYHKAITVNEEQVIYTLPMISSSLGSRFAPYMKYYPGSDTWEVVETMGFGRAAFYTVDFYTQQKVYFYYDGYIYAIDSGIGFYRSRVVREPWTAHQIPHQGDDNWGGLSAPRWNKIPTDSELAPQERYIQFKAELISEDQLSSPILDKLVVVQPHEVTMPASGTGNIYLKLKVGEKTSGFLNPNIKIYD